MRGGGAGQPRRIGPRHPFELVCQPVQAGVDFAEFLAGKRGLALDGHFAPVVAVPVAPPVARTATVVASVVLAIIIPPAVVILVVVISKPHRLAVIFVAARNDAVEPFANRHAGPASGVAGSFARFWTEASEIPRTARFHCAQTTSGGTRRALS